MPDARDRIAHRDPIGRLHGPFRSLFRHFDGESELLNLLQFASVRPRTIGFSQLSVRVQKHIMSKPTFANRLVTDRRAFLKTSTVLSAGLCGLFAETLPTPVLAQAKDQAGLDIVGPKPGYSPQVGTFVSTLTWMRDANGVLAATKGLTQADLDVLFDKNANTIGALMLHLAATETYYQMNTFDGKKWDSWSADDEAEVGSRDEPG